MLHRRPRKKSRAERPACPWCKARLPAPATTWEAYNPDGTICGTCECGAIFVIDETGKGSGMAVMDGLVLLCDGDMDAALKLERNVDYQTRSQFLTFGMSLPGAAVRGVPGLKPKIWSFRRIGEVAE